MKGKDKHAKAAVHPATRKEARANEQLAEDWRNTCPRWSFIRYAKAGDFALTALESEALPRVFDALAGYEGRFWRQIDGPDHRHCHAMAVSDCRKDVGEYLAAQGLDIDELYQLSTGNRGRLFGERVGSTFRIIFWDGEHKVYETEPRNT